jgi:hypothetical protein
MPKWTEIWWEAPMEGSVLRISSKQNERWATSFKLCVFYVDRNSKMTTTAGHSFYIGPIVFFLLPGERYRLLRSCVNTMTCGGSHLGFPIGIKNRGPSNDHSWAVCFQRRSALKHFSHGVQCGPLQSLCYFYADRKFKMATTAGHRLALDPLGKCSNAFFWETTNMIKAKLYMNVHWMVLYKLHVFCSDVQ